MSCLPAPKHTITTASERAPARPVTATLEGYVSEHRMAVRRLGVLARSMHPADEAQVSVILDTQQARLVAACGLQADSIEGVLWKLDLWFADHLADGLDEPETEPDRLIASTRDDLRRLLTANAAQGLCAVCSSTPECNR